MKHFNTLLLILAIFGGQVLLGRQKPKQRQRAQTKAMLVKRLTYSESFKEAYRFLENARMLAQYSNTVDSVISWNKGAAEKALKAYLLRVTNKVPQIHDLPKILDIAIRYNADFAQFRHYAQDVTLLSSKSCSDYTCDCGYGQQCIFKRREAKEFVDKTAFLLDFIRKQLGIPKENVNPKKEKVVPFTTEGDDDYNYWDWN